LLAVLRLPRRARRAVALSQQAVSGMAGTCRSRNEYRAKYFQFNELANLSTTAQFFFIFKKFSGQINSESRK